MVFRFPLKAENVTMSATQYEEVVDKLVKLESFEQMINKLTRAGVEFKDGAFDSVEIKIAASTQADMITPKIIIAPK